MTAENHWERHLKILWFGVFMTGVGFSQIMPFLSLFVDELGDFNKNQLTLYSGLAFSASFLTMAIVSPLWGRLADRYGRRPMLLRASLGMAVVIFAMGFVDNVWQLIGLRALQGIFGGYVSNANALIATETPKSNAGQALGTLMTGMMAGTLIGPLIGGILASVFGYRISFMLTGLILFLVFLLTFFFIEEHFKPSPKITGGTSRDFWQALPNKRLIISLFVTTLLIQTVNTAINPIISLFVREITHNAPGTTLWAGVVAAMPGIATVLAAPRFGKLGDKIGTDRMTRYGFILAFFVLIPTGFVTSVYVLMALRFMIGLSDSTMLPAVQTLLTKNTPNSMTSRVFAYNQSFQSLGAVSGPMVGAYIAQLWDYRGVFWFSAGLLALNFLWFSYHTKDLSAPKKPIASR